MEIDYKEITDMRTVKTRHQNGTMYARMPSACYSSYQRLTFRTGEILFIPNAEETQ